MLTIKPILSQNDFRQFVAFPRKIYKTDPFWVPPLESDILDRLDPQKNPFWEIAERQCWLVLEDGAPVGRICAIAYLPDEQSTAPVMGRFGFFECIDDIKVATLLFQTAAQWLKEKRYSNMVGPFNPSPTDEIGVMIEGFDTLPVAMAGHNPPYYQNLFESCGFIKNNESVARRYIRPKGITFENAFPKKLMQVVEIARKRKDISLRRLKKSEWENEIRIATDIMNTAMASLPGYKPLSYAEFLQYSNNLKLFLDPKMSIIAEVDHRPVGFAVAYPDVNEALKKVNGKLDLLGTVRFFINLPFIKRVSFKILMILPEFQSRGIEALLIHEIAKRIWQRKFREVDMSLAGEENIKSNRFTDNLGFKVYLRYRIYEKSI